MKSHLLIGLVVIMTITISSCSSPSGLGSSTKAITAFGFSSPVAAGLIDESAHTIDISLPSGTEVRTLTPSITHTGTSVSPGSGTPQDFTNPVSYTVTAEDGSTQAYTVTVTIKKETSKAIVDFSFSTPGASGIIDEIAHTIAVAVPFGTAVTALTPTIEIAGASVSPASDVPQDFTDPVTYIVTAEDGSTQNYIVTVSVASSSSKFITSFSFPAIKVTGTINATEVAVTVPFETDVTSLSPTIAITGASVSPVSGAPQNFTNPITYTVTAMDGSTQNYTVTVTAAKNSAKTITAFSFDSIKVIGEIDETSHIISALVPNGTDLTTLVATFSTTGESVYIGNNLQTSGKTPNNHKFTNYYKVNAANGTYVYYTVYVTESPLLYSITENTVTITGIGNTSQNISDAPNYWITSCVIPEAILGYPVTKIGDSAFSGCSSLTTLKIPSTITSIGAEAFQGCSKLTSIAIPSGVTSISNSTFSSDTSLTSITLPSGITSIGESAFYNCSSLAELSIPASVTSLGSGAFLSCSKLTSLIIPAGVTTIPASTFSNCSMLASISMPTSITSIGQGAFYGCKSLETITLPSALTTIAAQSFYGCSSICSISIPSNVTSINDYAFAGCSALKTITIPVAVTSIGTYTFKDCTNLTTADIPSGVTKLNIGLFSGCTNLSSLNIPANTTEIGYAAFENCTTLPTITIPSKVTTVGNLAFSGCTNLAVLVAKPSTPPTLGSTAFSSCSKLHEFLIPSASVTLYKAASVWKTYSTYFVGA